MKRSTVAAVPAIACAGLFILTLALPATKVAAQSVDQVREQFIGNWELVTYQSFDENGTARDRDYIGRILYDEYGNMSAIGMPRSLPERAAGSDEPLREGFAYFSNYRIIPEAGQVIHHVIGSTSFPSWVGGDQVRYYEFTDDGLLKLSLKNASGRITGTLTWRKLR